MRLFTAVPIPEDIKDSIANISIGLPYVRWVKREQIHITLCFIGEVSNGEYDLVNEILSEVKFPAFKLELSGVGQFLTAREIDTIWLGIKDPIQISSLNSLISKQLKLNGFSIDKRKYSPHLTLARIKRASRGKIHEYMEEFSRFQSTPFHVREFQLFSSKLYPEGPVHTLEREFLLGKK